MNKSSTLLNHLLATIAYRTKKAIQDAPKEFFDFSIGKGVRSPHEILWHMTNVLTFACRSFTKPENHWPKKEKSIELEIERFYAVLKELNSLFNSEIKPKNISIEQLLQGPISDVLTHVGQIAMLRRCFGSPVASENFSIADIDEKILEQ